MHNEFLHKGSSIESGKSAVLLKHRLFLRQGQVLVEWLGIQRIGLHPLVRIILNIVIDTDDTKGLLARPSGGVLLAALGQPRHARGRLHYVLFIRERSKAHGLCSVGLCVYLLAVAIS